MEAAAYASTSNYAARARSVEAAAYASTSDGAADVRSVETAAYANTSEYAAGARSAEAVPVCWNHATDSYAERLATMRCPGMLCPECKKQTALHFNYSLNMTHPWPLSKQAAFQAFI